MFISLKPYLFILSLLSQLAHFACIFVNLCGAKVLFSWTMYSAGLWLAIWAFQSLSNFVYSVSRHNMWLLCYGLFCEVCFQLYASFIYFRVSVLFDKYRFSTYGHQLARHACLVLFVVIVCTYSEWNCSLFQKLQ